MDWNLDLSPMNIWCEFEEDQLKTVFCRLHIVKNEVGPLVATNVTNEWWKWIESLDHGPVNIWREFEKDP